MQAHPRSLTLCTLSLVLYGASLSGGIFNRFQPHYLYFFCPFFKPSLFLHHSILHSSLHYFLLVPLLLRKWRPDTNSLLSRLFLSLPFLSVWPCFNLSNLLFFFFFVPYFLTRVSTALPFIFCPLLGFALSFWIFFYFSLPLFHFLYPLCIILIILTLSNLHNTIFSCCHASQALFLSDL